MTVAERRDSPPIQAVMRRTPCTAVSCFGDTTEASVRSRSEAVLTCVLRHEWNAKPIASMMYSARIVGPTAAKKKPAYCALISLISIGACHREAEAESKALPLGRRSGDKCAPQTNITTWAYSYRRESI